MSTVAEKLIKAIFLDRCRAEEGPEALPLLMLSPERYLDILKTYKDYQALSPQERFMKETFGVGPEGLTAVLVKFPPWKHCLAQRGILSIFSGWKRISGAVIDFDKKRPLEYISFDIGYGKREMVIREGTIALEGPEGSRVAVRISYVETREEGVPRSNLILTCEGSRREWLEKKAAEIEEWVRDNNYMRGKRLKPNGNFLDDTKEYRWEDIVLDDETRREIEKNIGAYFDKGLRKVYRANGIPMKRGIMLYGPPGTGKTLLGKVISSRIDATFIWVTPSDVTHAKDVAGIFDMARDLSPTILFFEDLDMYASTRSHTGNPEVLGEFLAQMDGFIENEDIFVMATTNDIKAIEPALKDRPSRFDVLIEFRPLDREGRKRLILNLCTGCEISGNPEALSEEVAEMTKDLTGAELKEFVTSAVKVAIEEGSVNREGKTLLTTEVFMKNKVRIGTKKRILGFGG